MSGVCRQFCPLSYAQHSQGTRWHRTYMPDASSSQHPTLQGAVEKREGADNVSPVLALSRHFLLDGQFDIDLYHMFFNTFCWAEDRGCARSWKTFEPPCRKTVTF